MSLRNLRVALDDDGLLESLAPAAVQMAQALGPGDVAFAAGGQVGDGPVAQV